MLILMIHNNDENQAIKVCLEKLSHQLRVDYRGKPNSDSLPLGLVWRGRWRMKVTDRCPGLPKWWGHVLRSCGLLCSAQDSELGHSFPHPGRGKKKTLSRSVSNMCGLEHWQCWQVAAMLKQPLPGPAAGFQNAGRSPGSSWRHRPGSWFWWSCGLCTRSWWTLWPGLMDQWSRGTWKGQVFNVKIYFKTTLNFHC